MIYFIQAEGIGHIKIGFTGSDDAELRVVDLQTGSPVPLRLLGTIPGTMEDEKNLHRRFSLERVHGEWFRPVPRLLGMIPKHEPTREDRIEVVERSIQIRTLTVGRKQFGKSLLDQLPVQELICWESAYCHCTDDTYEGDAEEKQISTWIDGVVWGWVIASESKQNTRDRQFRWVIFEDRGQLFKYQDFDNGVVRMSTSWAKSSVFFHQLYASRLLLSGFRPQDQLFFGV